MTDVKFEASLGIYKFVWDNGIRMNISRLDNDGYGELSIYYKNGGDKERLLHLARHNLLSTTMAGTLARALKDHSDMPWKDMLTLVSAKTLEDYRRGEPVESLGHKPENMAIEYMVNPILQLDAATTFYGPGESAKSLLGDLIAVMVAYNKPILGWNVDVFGPVLIFDWEASKRDHERRVWAIKQGLGIHDDTDMIWYRFCNQPFSYDLQNIQQMIVEKQIVLPIIDSRMGASTVSQDVTYNSTTFYNSLRQIRRTSLTIDHVNRSDWRNDKTDIGPGGAVVNWNRSRAQFEIRKTQEPGSNYIDVVMIHRKSNEGKHIKEVGMRIYFDETIKGELNSIRFEPMDVIDNPQLAKTLSISQAIYQALDINHRLTLDEMCDITGKERKSLQAELYRQGKQNKIGQVGKTDNGEILWALKDDHEDSDFSGQN